MFSLFSAVGPKNQLNLSHLAPQDGNVCIPLNVPSVDKLGKGKALTSEYRETSWKLSTFRTE